MKNKLIESLKCYNAIPKTFELHYPQMEWTWNGGVPSQEWAPLLQKLHQEHDDGSFEMSDGNI